MKIVSHKNKIMILIADSGSTKTLWCFIEKNGTINYHTTSGINPVHQTSQEIEHLLQKELKPLISTEISSLYFYGAGCVEEKKSTMKNVLIQIVGKNTKLEINDDLLAVARALCGKNAGIACILGTGSNSCLYNGTSIVDKIPALGYILGDEGSGAVLGRNLISDYFKRELPMDLHQKFETKYGKDLFFFIENVYKKPLANTFLARYTVFLNENIEHEYVQDFLSQNFNNFIKRNILKYENAKKIAINFNGSIAFYFKSVLSKAINDNNLTLGKILKDPMEGLIEFHQNL